MKKILLIFLLFVAFPLAALSLNEESKAEARLLNSFIKALYAQRQSDPRTFAYLEKALQESPDSKYLKRMLVSAALLENNLTAAEPYLSYIKQGDNAAEDWTTYGYYQLKKGDYKAAQDAYEEALKLRPDDEQIFYQYVLLLSYTDFDKAVEQLLKHAEDYPFLAPAIYTEIGNLNLRHKKMQAALDYFNKASLMEPENPAPRLGRGEVYEKTSQFFLMLHEFEELEKMGYADASTYFRMASVFLLGQDFEKAEEYFLKTKKEDNSHPPTAYFLALLSERKGDYAHAAQYLKDASDYENSSEKQIQVAFYLSRFQRREESFDTLKKAYRKFPDNVEVGYFYAMALHDTKHYRKAEKVLRKILQTNPSYENARLQYAYTLESLKKYKKMEEELDIILAANPQNAPALNLYAYSLAIREKDLDKAQNLIARALSLYPQENAFIDTQAWIYFQKGKWDEAENLLLTIPEELVKINPEIAYHLGAVYFAKGNFERAGYYLEMALTDMKEAKKLYRKLPKVYRKK